MKVKAGFLLGMPEAKPWLFYPGPGGDDCMSKAKHWKRFFTRQPCSVPSPWVFPWLSSERNTEKQHEKLSDAPNMSSCDQNRPLRWLYTTYITLQSTRSSPFPFMQVSKVHRHYAKLHKWHMHPHCYWVRGGWGGILSKAWRNQC